MNDYEARQQARRARLEDAAVRANAEAERSYRRAGEIGAAIDGQPILVGHHSEARHRRDAAKIDRLMRGSIEAGARARELAAKASAVGRGGISSDDPDAVEKLEAELERVQAKRAQMVRINALYRQGDASALADLGLDLERLRERVASVGLSWVRAPFEGYQLSNASANARRIRQRIEALRAQAGTPEREALEIGPATISEDAAMNRTLVTFREAPPAGIRAELKAAGFRWRPSVGAWSRHRSESAWAAALYVARRANGEGQA